MEADPKREWYTFEKSVTKVGGDDKGFADVWKKDYFAWECKGKKKDARPAWLDTAHRNLDAAVFAAYGWPADLTDEEILARLLALNQERA